MKHLILATVFAIVLGLTIQLTKNTTDNRWIMARIDEELGPNPDPVKRQQYFELFKRRFAIPEKL